MATDSDKKWQIALVEAEVIRLDKNRFTAATNQITKEDKARQKAVKE